MHIKKSLIIGLSTILILNLFLINNAAATVISFTKDFNKVNFKLDKGSMQINICKSDIIEVKYTIFDVFENKQSLVVNNKWPQKAQFSVAENNGVILITTSKLKIRVDKASNAITYTDLKGNIICDEYKAGGKTMQAATIAGISTYNCETQFNSPATEGLFGLGCHPEDSLAINYKGRNQSMAIKYMTGAIPVLLSTKGYGLLWDNYSASNFYGAEANNTRFKF
jgi:alpha-D-xyloside xylohydrolase